MGCLSHARYVQHPRNAGWPTGREPHGHGVLVVVSGGESPPQGEGGQAGRHLKRGGAEMGAHLIRVDGAPPESGLTSKEAPAGRGGAGWKEPAPRNPLAPTPHHRSP